jgi:LuxR family transcriptional regulator, quorum-sensing system regulator BjaR1
VGQIQINPPRNSGALPIRTDQDAFRFNTRLRNLKTPASCAELFRAAIAPIGFDTFACGVVDLNQRERNVFYLLDWPDEWRRFYLSSGLIERDPVVDALAVRHQPFTWSDLRKDRKFKQVGKEALKRAAAAGWSEGLVVPVARGANRVGLVSLVGHQAEIPFEDRAFLCLISMCLHTHLRTLMVDGGFAVPPAGLTLRELACIKLVATGATDRAIAKAMGVAPSTAHEFVEKAKRKLRTRSRVEMVAVAASLGIIDL